MSILPAGLHAIPPGLWCVPSALAAITGADVESVLHPALNRHGCEPSLTDIVVGVYRHVTLDVLWELGYAARRYKGKRRQHVSTIARMSAERWAGHTVLVFTNEHALVVRDGRVFDNHMPHGPTGKDHPYSAAPIEACYLIERKRG